MLRTTSPHGLTAGLIVVALAVSALGWPSSAAADPLNPDYYPTYRAVGEVKLSARMTWGDGGVHWGPDAVVLLYEDNSVGSLDSTSMKSAFGAGVHVWSSKSSDDVRYAVAEACLARAMLRNGASPVAPTGLFSGGVRFLDGTVSPAFGLVVEAAAGTRLSPAVSLGFHSFSDEPVDGASAAAVFSSGVGLSYTHFVLE